MNKLNKKHIFGTLTALTVGALAGAGPAMAQDGGANNGGGAGNNGTTRTAASNQQPSDNSNWGWLGLLGLAGLAGLRKPAPTVVHQDTNRAARAH